MAGKQVRLARLFDPGSGRTVIVPMDHGLTQGPIEGLGDIPGLAGTLADSGADGLLVHRGMIRFLPAEALRRASLIVHLSGSTELGPDPGLKNTVGSVQTALSLGADAVSVHVNLGHPAEERMIKDLGRISDECFKYGLPLLAMMYHRPPAAHNSFEAGPIAHGVRVAAELGADVVKVNYTGDVESFARVVAAAPVPVVIAGGPKMDTDLEVLRTVKGAMEAGAAGVSIGRNVFQHPRPGEILGNIRRLVHGSTDQDTSADYFIHPAPRGKLNRGN